ncbi:MAG TPA: threo-3-hydroxy-L-aspartate ammonia-lyase [Nocardioidaceae bacterium]|nr:threo-3-hydroxy-L-aspartate ammonia-lyase [Nocardioidaceae bacterium]
MTDIPSYDDVQDAARLIEGSVARTPVLRSRLMDEQFGMELFFKCENFQRTGAFKFRGAFNALSHFSAEQRRTGVVTFSSGNHGQAVARAAALLDIPATVVMPEDAPESKAAATRGYGAQVVTYDRYGADREQTAVDIAENEGRTLIPPFDHPHVIAGQGTAAKELFEDVGELDALFVPLGGGGLLAGSLLSARALAPGCRVYGVEPAAGDDGRQSLRRGAIVHIDPPKTLADGAQTTHVGVHNFAIIRSGVADILTAADAELVETMRLFATRMKIVVEPTGCLGLAGVGQLRHELAGRRVGVVVSGGNVDVDRLGSLLFRS